MKNYRTSYITLLLLIFAYILTFSNQVYSQDEVQNKENMQQIDVVVDSYSFEPDKITVKVNEPVELKLRSVTSIIGHNISMSYPEAGLEIDEDVGSGKDVSVTFTPTRAGEYEFYCSKSSIFGNHKKKGMVGTLVVVE